MTHAAIQVAKRAVKRELVLWFTAVQFFTRLRVPRWVGHSSDQLNDASRYFPLVGWLVGALSALGLIIASLVFPFTLAVALSMLVGILITGAFHEDGLADSCDGFGGGWEKPEVLAIMKDSRLGTYGAIGLGAALGIKFLALLALSTAPTMTFINLAVIFVAAHALSRFCAVTVIYTQTYVRDDEAARAKPAAQSIRLSGVLFAGVFALMPLAALAWQPLFSSAQMNFRIGLIVVACGVVRFLLGRYFIKRIGGYTGDCLGCMQQVCEIVFYLGLVVATPVAISIATHLSSQIGIH